MASGDGSARGIGRTPMLVLVGVGALTALVAPPLLGPGVASLTGRYWVTRVVRPVTFVSPVTRGRVAIEGERAVELVACGCRCG